METGSEENRSVGNREDTFGVLSIGVPDSVGRAPKVRKQPAAFEATCEELGVLAQYWMTKVIDFDFEVFRFGLMSDVGLDQSRLASDRVNEIGAYIGSEEVNRVTDAAYDEYGRAQDPTAWRMFRHGTEHERHAFRLEFVAKEMALDRAEQDRFYASVLKFVAGEPSDIRPDTIDMERAKRAKVLISENPMLAEPESKMTLLDVIYDGEDVPL